MCQYSLKREKIRNVLRLLTSYIIKQCVFTYYYISVEVQMQSKLYVSGQVLPNPRSGKRGSVIWHGRPHGRRENPPVGVARRLAQAHPPAAAARRQLSLTDSCRVSLAAIFRQWRRHLATVTPPSRDGGAAKETNLTMSYLNLSVYIPCKL